VLTPTTGGRPVSADRGASASEPQVSLPTTVALAFAADDLRSSASSSTPQLLRLPGRHGRDHWPAGRRPSVAYALSGSGDGERTGAKDGVGWRGGISPAGSHRSRDVELNVTGCMSREPLSMRTSRPRDCSWSGGRAPVPQGRLCSRSSGPLRRPRPTCASAVSQATVMALRCSQSQRSRSPRRFPNHEGAGVSGANSFLPGFRHTWTRCQSSRAIGARRRPEG
jgi:hypothetical protein